jgi:hypothetical protein
MITFSQLGIYGRLGNQLWQIASTIGIATKNVHDYVFPEWKYQRYFDNKLPTGGLDYQATYYEGSSNPYYRDIKLLPSVDYDLDGYFQSYKYFEHCKGTVLYYLNSFPRLKSDGVAVHVRRGDYVRLQKTHPLQTVGYYSDAMDAFSGEHFTIFSDDIAWCKENLKGYNVRYFVSSSDDVVDFQCMAGFDKFIIANSSYSWWAAYLSGSNKVVAPKNWVVGETTDDRVPSEWIKI